MSLFLDGLKGTKDIRVVWWFGGMGWIGDIIFFPLFSSNFILFHQSLLCKFVIIPID
jgi:hypothetical protein